jgi:D-xylose transport system permease protein
MSDLKATEPAIDRPPTTADVTPQTETDAPAQTNTTRLGGLSIPTSALRAYTMVFALIAIWIYFYFQTDGVFLESRNFSNLMRQTAVTGVLAVGMLLVIVAGQIDLSVGSVVGLTGAISAVMLNNWGYGLVPSIMTAIIIGFIIGALHGALVAYANIPAFIVTLGGLLAWRGAVKGFSAGETIPINLQSFKAIGQDYIDWRIGYALALAAIALLVWFALRRIAAQKRHGLPAASTLNTLVRTILPAAIITLFVYWLNSYAGVPIPVLILIAVAAAGAFLAQNTTFGRYLYAIGGNPDAARLSGINLRAHILLVFCLMGALAGLASIIYTARVGSASPDAGTLLELDAIAACVIGGASLMGGRGAIFGALLGALFMASIDNGMSLANVRDFIQDIIKGLILVGAVGLDMLGRRRG